MGQQRPDVMKNIISSNSSQFYEFGTTRNRGRKSSTSAGKESLIEFDTEEAEYDYEDQTEILEQSIADDDDDYNPMQKSRITRSASNISDRKPDLKLEIGQIF